jgi:hypothetical protein
MFKIQQDRYVVRTRCYQVMELCTWKPTCLAIRHHCLIQMNSYVPVTSLFIIICPWYAPEPNIMHLAVGQRLTKVDHLLLKPPLSREVLEHPHSFIKIPNKQPQRLREGLNPFQKALTLHVCHAYEVHHTQTWHTISHGDRHPI